MSISNVVGAATGVMRKALPLPECAAVIVAAGSAQRMAGQDKILTDLAGQPVIQRTVRAFQDCPAIKTIVVVTRPDQIIPVRDLCAGMEKLLAVVAGGKTRAESVWLGLQALPKTVKLAAIHDGARPLVTGAVIDRTVRAAHSYGAAAPAVPVKDTIKAAQGGVVKSTLDRKLLQAVQTPQAFDLDLIRGALKKALEAGEELTDDCAAVEKLGMSVKLVEGDEKNLKITTPLDLTLAAAILEAGL